MICEFHMERLGVQVPAHRMGMCLDCFRGRPIKPSEQRNIDLRPLPRYTDEHGNLLHSAVRALQVQSEDNL